MSAELAASHTEPKASHQTIVEQAAQLQELNLRDPLTQLHNRRHFDDNAQLLFEQCARHRRPLAIVVADIDWFKRINDTFSHATGDAAGSLHAQLEHADRQLYRAKEGGRNRVCFG